MPTRTTTISIAVSEPSRIRHLKSNDGLENTLKEQIDNLNTLSGVSFGNIQGVCTCEVPAATNATRLSWLTQRTYNFTGNGWVSRTWYMYLDNIRVTIVK